MTYENALRFTDLVICLWDRDLEPIDFSALSEELGAEEELIEMALHYREELGAPQ